MGEQKIRDQIDIELSRTYFGNNESKAQFSPQEPESPPHEKAEQDKVKDVPYTVRKHWSPLIILLILWIIGSLIFAAGYLLRGKRIIFNVSINVEPDVAAKKETQPPKIIQDFLALAEKTSSGEKIRVSLPGTMHSSRKKIIVTPPATLNDLLTKMRGTSPSRPAEIKPERSAAPAETPGVKTLYDFELAEDGWEIPSWELDKPDHVARSLAVTGAFASRGNSGLELVAEFPGGQWTAALVEVQQYLDLASYANILIDVYIPDDCPEGLRCKLILTIGEDWRFVEMSRSTRLIPGRWTTISADISDGSSDWKRATVDDSFRSDIRKIALRIESNHKPAYSGPIYIDNLRATSSQR